MYLAKYEKKAAIIASILLLTLLCVFSYVNAPESNHFRLESLNPIDTLAGLAFIIGFSLDLSDMTSAILAIVALTGFWMACFHLLRKIFEYIDLNFED